MACCDAPDPRILEKNGRSFCRNCRRYLDAKPDEEPPQNEAAQETKEENPE